MPNIADIRKEYIQMSLLETEVDDNPFSMFSKWWDEAVKSAINEVNAMTLSTATRNGMPSARIVLLKDFSDNGFVFFSNYESSKGKELSENPLACLVFFWKELERQVRISGTAAKIQGKESDEYFASRPRGSQIGAWASPQSRIIANRELIEENVKIYRDQFADKEIPRPENWGGYILKPTTMEFWQGRQNRLHDRIQYRLQENREWIVERLAP